MLVSFRSLSTSFANDLLFLLHIKYSSEALRSRSGELTGKRCSMSKLIERMNARSCECSLKFRAFVSVNVANTKVGTLAPSSVLQNARSKTFAYFTVTEYIRVN